MKNTGTFEQPVSIHIDISSLLDDIQTIIQELIINYFNTISDNVNTDDIQIEYDGDDLTIENIRYQGAYIHTHIDATMLEPADDDITFEPDESAFSAKKLTNYINTHGPQWLQNKIKIRNIIIDTTETSLQEYEPDWDAMSGGYDNI